MDKTIYYSKQYTTISEYNKTDAENSKTKNDEVADFIKSLESLDFKFVDVPNYDVFLKLDAKKNGFINDENHRFSNKEYTFRLVGDEKTMTAFYEKYTNVISKISDNYLYTTAKFAKTIATTKIIPMLEKHPWHHEVLNVLQKYHPNMNRDAVETKFGLVFHQYPTYYIERHQKSIDYNDTALGLWNYNKKEYTYFENSYTFSLKIMYYDLAKFSEILKSVFSIKN
jgi:hypothetical protein